jgi:hypothetical protein
VVRAILWSALDSGVWLCYSAILNLRRTKGQHTAIGVRTTIPGSPSNMLDHLPRDYVCHRHQPCQIVLRLSASQTGASLIAFQLFGQHLNCLVGNLSHCMFDGFPITKTPSERFVTIPTRCAGAARPLRPRRLFGLVPPGQDKGRSNSSFQAICGAMGPADRMAGQSCFATLRHAAGHWS